MLDPKVKLTTDYGVINIYKCIPGVRVDTPDGMQIVKHLYKGYNGLIRIGLLFHDGSRITCDKEQLFFTAEDTKISVRKVKVGAVLMGKLYPLKVTMVIEKYTIAVYYIVVVNSFDSRFFLSNGLLTTR